MAVTVFNADLIDVYTEDDKPIYPGQPNVVMSKDGKKVLGMKIGFGDDEHLAAYTDSGLPIRMPDSEFTKVPFLSTPFKVIGEAQSTPDPNPANP